MSYLTRFPHAHEFAAHEALYAAHITRTEATAVQLYDASDRLMHAIAHRDDPWGVRAAQAFAGGDLAEAERCAAMAPDAVEMEQAA